MVKPFSFSKLPLIGFGPGKLDLLPGMISRFGKKIIVVANQRSFTGTEAASVLFETLERNDISFSVVNIPGEPSPEMIDVAVAGFRSEKIDAVVSVGGGSVLDAGKAISAMLCVKGSVKEFLEGVGTREHPGMKVPFIAVPTTSGTGSEATSNAVLSETGKNGFKRSLRHDNFVPDVAIVDPVLTVGCPPEVTAASGMDCFSQLAEAFLSVKSCEYTDALAVEGLKAVKDSLQRSFSDGTDITARSRMSFAALTSGICLANAGLGVVHGFASSIGGMVSIPHGVVCGTLMASANEATVRALRKSSKDSAALQKYAMLGRMFIESTVSSDDFYIDGYIDYLKELTSFLNLPRLGSFGIKPEDMDAICRNTGQKNNPVRLDYDALIEILTARI
ncbi:MAG TPA: iron-containing alcohol dehydrogenase [Bacteroidales bacterium]|jgi:alcohol dehydrogenase class IV|nr:iron-containing alcohol dehydrogenase [Bacteroidales bacterium]